MVFVADLNCLCITLFIQLNGPKIENVSNFMFYIRNSCIVLNSVLSSYYIPSHYILFCGLLDIVFFDNISRRYIICSKHSFHIIIFVV